MAEGHCDCGERCSCPPGSEVRAKCNCWHEGEPKPIKAYGLLMAHKEQEPLITKHCFGDCGKVSMAGAIHDDLVGPMWVCPEEMCPWLLKQMDEPYGNTMSFGRPHEVYLRTLTDTPAAGVAPSLPADVFTVNFVRLAGLSKDKARECEEIVRTVLAARGVAPASGPTEPSWWGAALNRRATVEQWMFDAARGKRPMPTPDELRAWAIKLGTPEQGEPNGVSAPQPFTAKQKGIVAGDGQPCPNDHDPDCRWPDCNCRRSWPYGVSVPDSKTFDE